MIQWYNFLFGSLLFSNSLAQLTSLNLVFEWTELEYEFPSNEYAQAALASGQYIPGNGVPIDVDVIYRKSSCECNGRNSAKCLPTKNEKNRIISRTFVTIPRFTTGIPITLATVSRNQQGFGGPVLKGYPDFWWNESQGQSCNGIISVFRVAIDDCDRLWVLDTGRIGDNQVCPPQLLVFNLRDDKLLRRYKFPKDQYTCKSLFITPVVDVKNVCVETMVYMADVEGFGILVYDYKQNKSWRVENKLMFPNPDYGNFTIAGQSFDLMDGIFGMALSPKAAADRQLYFHALASASENRVSLAVLDNPSIVDSSDPSVFVQVGKRGIQSAAEAMDRNGNLFFGLVDPIAVGCWDSTQTDYDASHIRVVALNNDTLQFASGLKVVQSKKNEEELWVLTCRFQRVATGTISSKEINFRIQMLPIHKILGGSTKCTTAGAALASFQW